MPSFLLELFERGHLAGLVIEWCNSRGHLLRFGFECRLECLQLSAHNVDASAERYNVIAEHRVITPEAVDVLIESIDAEPFAKPCADHLANLPFASRLTGLSPPSFHWNNAPSSIPDKKMSAPVAMSMSLPQSQ